MVELVQATGSDGRLYAVRAIEWNLEKVEKYWGRINKFGIFSDNMPKNAMGFLSFVMTTKAIWFEVVDLTEDPSAVIGMMYLTDIVQGVEDQFVEATWHAMVWDARAGIRRPVFKAAIQALFQKFGFHRIRTEIPLKFGGVIRQAKKIGFIEEGVLRESVKYEGVWFNSLSLSVLEKEALAWEL
jgi:RimJ/RimL family protein N-acetyltransferase